MGMLIKVLQNWFKYVVVHTRLCISNTDCCLCWYLVMISAWISCFMCHSLANLSYNNFLATLFNSSPSVEWVCWNQAYLTVNDVRLFLSGTCVVIQVGYNTAASLGRHSKRLHTLDLSWCRNLTDEAVGFIVDNCLSLRVLKTLRMHSGIYFWTHLLDTDAEFLKLWSVLYPLWGLFWNLQKFI